MGLGVTLFCISSGIAQGAVYYVRSAAAGAANGSDWSNAYQALPSSMVRGATYYMASGTYAGYTFSTAENGTNTITVKKATLADHGTSAGWSDSYDNGPAVFTNTVQFSKGYFILDGQTGGGPQSWTNGFGFKIQSLSTTQPRPGIYVGEGRKNVTLRHFEVQGNGGDGDGDGSGQANDALSIEVGTDQTTVSYAYLHDMGRCLIFGHGNNMFFEYIYGGTFESTPVEHSEVASIWATINAPPPLCTNVTFANCVWSHIEGTGGLMMYADGVKIYGNTFYRPAGVTFPVGLGAIATWYQAWGTGTFAHGRIYNNSFIDLGQGFPVSGISWGSTNAIDNVVENNVFYNCSLNFGGISTHDYNLFINTTGENAASEAHGASASSAIFNDYHSLNFTLQSNTVAGTNAGAPYDIDPNGVPRTTGTRGAYEFGSGAAGVLLKPQSTGTQISLSWPDTGFNFKLYATASLNPPALWTQVTNAPVLANGWWSVSPPAPVATGQFYRLQGP